MDGLEFLLIILVGVAVIGWYVINEEKNGAGARGPLALRPEPAAKPRSKSRYRTKPRIARRRGPRRLEDVVAAPAERAYRMREKPGDEALRRFRRQDEVRYRVKDLIGDPGAAPPPRKS